MLYFIFIFCINSLNSSGCLLNAVNPLTPKISVVILLSVYHTVLVILLGEFDIGSTNNPLIDIFLYSHHLSA